MTFLDILYNLIIAPLELIIETVFCFVRVKFAGLGIMGALVAVSLTVNFLALPLYNIADRLQLKERETQRRLAPWVRHIKKYFSGDEQFMRLSAYYKENGYHPLYALRSSLSIMIEIPFFIAAYHFLSHSTSLQGSQFCVLADLGRPDGLVSLGGNLSVNVLPVIMTAINLVSGAVYTRNAPAKEKIQLYAMTLLFLVILYNSPSGLVCYWILNNLFSLAKNVVSAHAKHPRRLGHAAVSVLLLSAALYLLVSGGTFSLAKRLLLLGFAAAVALLPAVFRLLPRVLRVQPALPESGRLPLIVLPGLGLALLCGFLLPSSVIATSPAEFSFIGSIASPMSYIWSSLSVCAGLFLFWPLCVYRLSGAKLRSALSLIMPCLFLMALADAYLFRFRYGLLSVFFKLNDASVLDARSAFYTLLPLLAFVLAAALSYVALRLDRAAVYVALLFVSLCMAEAAVGIGKARVVAFSYGKLAQSHVSAQKAPESVDVVYELSRTQKNVVVLFLDRAISSFFPYFLEQFPQFSEQYKGFVFYPNTLSYSNNTPKASPAMMGGYEYTPENENRRPGELLKDKHDEAMLVMPRLFHDAGFEVTVTDPPLPSYSSWQHDYTLFAPYPDMHVSTQWGALTPLYKASHEGQLLYDAANSVRKKALGFAFMQALPPLLRKTFYQGGGYFREEAKALGEDTFLNNYTQLFYLPELTGFDAERPTYTFIANDTTHTYQLLAGDDYHPEVDITEANVSGTGSYRWKNSSDTEFQNDRAAYHVNAAALLQVGKWLAFLQDNGVYDNTRIIIVADHGFDMYTPAFGEMEDGFDHARYNPLLMVKDFDAGGAPRTDASFMTNADTLFLATEGLPVSGTNPFTHRRFEDFRDKTQVNIYPVQVSADYNEINAPAYLADKSLWYLDTVTSSPCWSVHDNIFESGNWIKIQGGETR